MLCNDRGIDRRILLEADSLEEAGWSVVILAMPLDTGPVKEDSRIARIGSGPIAIPLRESGILALYRLVRANLPMNNWLMRLLKAGAWTFFVDYERFYVDLFLAEGRRHPADVVVAHDLPMLAVARALANEKGARLVYDSHELYSEQEFSRRQRAQWARIERRHIGACDRVITVNPSIAHQLEQRYALRDVAVIHNAERVAPLPQKTTYLHDRFSIDLSGKVLLFQGGLSEGRNLRELVKAMALVTNSKVHLVLLGGGGLAPVLRRLAERLGIADRVHFHAAVPQTELLAITASADAGIVPYQAICLNNYYCTPNKLFEFIAARLPILASDLPELRRIVDGNQIGQVTDLKTPEDMARAIDAFFADPTRLSNWRRRQDIVSAELNWQREGIRLQNIYETLR